MTENLILVANIGSTSFKFRLFEMPGEGVLASGRVERIGEAEGVWQIAVPGREPRAGGGLFPDYPAAIGLVERELKAAGLDGFDHVAAFGFKPVMARGISGTQVLDETVLGAMEDLVTLLPAHNPPYIAAVRAFRGLHPSKPCIGTFETAFFDAMAPEVYRYPIPLEWERRHGIRRYGFHGASHRYISERCAELLGKPPRRLISCHLGGSSSLAAVRDGVAIDTSFGMTPQCGLPMNNRVGDFDVFAAFYLARDLGLGLENVERALARESGLKGMSGLDSGDMRTLKDAAATGDENARVAIDVYARSIRRYIGQFVLEMDGVDLIVFTGGIGENNDDLRERVCAGATFLGLEIDPARNRAAVGGAEAVISSDTSRVEVRVIPTNEELIIARGAWAKLGEMGGAR